MESIKRNANWQDNFNRIRIDGHADVRYSVGKRTDEKIIILENPEKPEIDADAEPKPKFSFGLIARIVHF